MRLVSKESKILNKNSFHIIDELIGVFFTKTQTTINLIE